MEIFDYLKVARRRLWVIVVIPLLAGAGVLGYWQLSAKDYQATAYVFAPDLLAGTGSQFSGPAGVANWVNEFTATAVSPRVTRRVAAQADIPVADIKQGLEVTQLEASGQLQVSFSWTDGAVANKVVEGVATATPRALFRPRLAQAEHALAESESSLEESYQDSLAAATARGNTRPDLLYQGRMSTLVDLENARADIPAGDVAATRAADAQITRVKEQLAALEQEVVEYQNLNAQRKAATTVLARAQEEVQSAQTAYDGASGAVTLLPVQPPRLASVLLNGVLAAVVAGLVIAFCLVAALEILRTRRPTTPEPAESPTSRHAGRSRQPSKPSPRAGQGSRKPTPGKTNGVRSRVADAAVRRGDG
ncbi:MAG TPA: hypothetical protein VFG63_02470 [Nocardioidaceae bacterium]|nr:hypothetical protein [Nocardioidaceae bacterium]